MSFHSCPPPPPYNVLFFLKNGVCGPLYFFRTVAKSGVECCCLHSAGVDLFWGTPLEILICPTGEWHTGVAAWTVCKLAQEAENRVEGTETFSGPQRSPLDCFQKTKPPFEDFSYFLWAFKDFHGFELVSRSSKTVFWSLLKPVQNHF